MVVADPTATLLTACEFGYGKRTTFGPGDEMAGKELPVSDDGTEDDLPVEEESSAEEPDAEDLNSANRYRTQRRGGKGVIDIKATKRNGKVVGIAAVHDTDEILMMTTRGKIQRIAAKDVSVIGRNTQGVRIMSMDEGDSLTAIVRVPSEEIDPSEIEAASAPIAPAPDASVQDSVLDSTPESDASDASEGE
jgi:DNA gyrase subunit A